MIFSRALFLRNTNFTGLLLRSKATSCRKTDCCGNPIENEPPEKYIVEKSCCRSIFESWTPKIPELNRCENRKTRQMLPLYMKKHCTPGMKFKEKSRCEIEAEARECIKRNHPKIIGQCPKPMKKAGDSLPSFKAAALSKDSKTKLATTSNKPNMRKKCEKPFPDSDWNHDGTL